MRAATAYFAGVGTVAVAIVAGLGGGLLLGDIMSPRQPKHPSSEVARLEQQRSASQPIPAMNVASQPVPYVGATQIANTVAEPTAQPLQAPPQAREAPPEPSAAREHAAPQDSYAKAGDADFRRRVDDKRKSERRQQWAERRKWRQRGDEDLKEVEASVREDSERRLSYGRGPGRGFSLFDD